MTLLALIKNAASTNVQDTGRTPLHLASLARYGDTESTVSIVLRWGVDETALDTSGRSQDDLLDTAHECRTRSREDIIERVRLLLVGAPADRVWRRRGWLAMLRSRASTTNTNAGGEAADGSNDAGGGEGESRASVAGIDGAFSVRSGMGGWGTRGVGEAGNEAMGGVGIVDFRDAVARLVELESEGVFCTIVGFLRGRILGMA